jgi:hypothetical protein
VALSALVKAGAHRVRSSVPPLDVFGSKIDGSNAVLAKNTDGSVFHSLGMKGVALT